MKKIILVALSLSYLNGHAFSSTTTQNFDGSSTTYFSNGQSATTTNNFDGSTTTNYSNGSSSTSHKNFDGSVSTNYYQPWNSQ